MEYTIDHVPPDIINIIHHQLGFRSQLNFKSASKNLEKYPVTNLLDEVPNNIYTKIYGYNIFKIYPHTTRLEYKIYIPAEGIKYLMKLQILHVDYDIAPDELKDLVNLVELKIPKNNMISDLNHLIHLRTLDISNSYKITNDGIKSLTNLTELDISGNKNNVIDITHLTNLTTLYMSCNPNITHIRNLTKLRTLSIRGDSGINDLEIKSLTNLTDLNADYNNKITDVNHLVNLRRLNAQYDCGITDVGISSLVNLTKIYIHGNVNITKKIEIKLL
jgi:hypothetical protein